MRSQRAKGALCSARWAQPHTWPSIPSAFLASHVTSTRLMTAAHHVVQTFLRDVAGGEAPPRGSFLAALKPRRIAPMTRTYQDDTPASQLKIRGDYARIR